jgi:hypothetical protein
MQLVLGLFAGGKSLARAFDASAQDWPEVEGRLENGAMGVLVFERPVDALARALEAGEQPEAVLKDWTSDARRILATCDARGQGCTLICAADARAAPDRLRALLADPFGLQADPAGLALPPADPLHRLVAQALVAASSDIAPLTAALDARALRFGDDDRQSTDAAAALDALRAMRRKEEVAREEIELLRAHLHVVQSQAETFYGRARRAASALGKKAADIRIAALKNELAAVRAEADGLRVSLSWRITAPLRAISVLLPRALSPESLRLRRQVSLVRSSGLFDAAWYLERYGDIARSKLDPAEHYLRCGWREGRRPGPEFDGAKYLRANPDVAASGVNPLVHYLEHGKAEGRLLAPRLASGGTT